MTIITFFYEKTLTTANKLYTIKVFVYSLIKLKVHIYNKKRQYGGVIMEFLDLEIEELIAKSEELAEINDLWYFIKSGDNWIMGG